MKNSNEIDHLLKDAGLKITATRQLILSLFKESSFALSYNDIERSVNKDLDKVTVYRTLKTFEEKSIIHSVFDNSNQVKYALCHDCCKDHEHICNHAHFRCQNCEHTICIDHVSIPKIVLPEGFTKSQSSMLIEGICKDCNEKLQAV